MGKLDKYKGRHYAKLQMGETSGSCDKARRCLADGIVDKVVSIGDTEVKMGNSVFIATFKLRV